MTRNYVIGIIVLLVIIIVGWMIADSGGNAVTPVNTATTTGETLNTGVASSTVSGTDNNGGVAPDAITIVNFTDNGFSPASVTIKQGETVRFVNQSSELIWVASNPHPTHTDYPGFDEKMAVSIGGTYDFTFTKIGTWGYHNHKDPAQKGEVIVD